MQLWKILLVTIVVFAAALGSGFDLIYRVGYTLLGVLTLSYLWARNSLTGIRVERKPSAYQLEVGQTLGELFTAYNGSMWPKLWLEFQDYSTLPAHLAGQVVSVRPFASTSWTVSTPCLARGKYRLGPMVVIAGDPFGIFHRQLMLDETSEVMVYPKMVELGHFALSAGELVGGYRSRQRAHYVTPNVLTVRDYLPGDSFNRIHWASTAKTGSLMSKDFEPDPTSDLWILLDMEAAPQAGEGLDSTEEYGVVAAASLARHFLRSGRSVGLVAYGQSPIVVPAERGLRQLGRLLEALALVRAQGHVPLAEVIAAEQTHFERQATVIAITPSLGEDWIAGLRYLKERGLRCIALLIEAGTFGGSGASLLAVGSLAAAGIPYFLAKRGEPLDHVLRATQVLGRGGSLAFTPHRSQSE
ncbi:MAG: DUF58 domain-containing protein [Chloroflexi bacterium]|nr:DUF58 domain-containing protein [Chloroflexota bacterium]